MNGSESISVQNILKAISNSHSLDIFLSIAKDGATSESLNENRGLTNKQYYSRIKKLKDIGVIQIRKGHFSLTSLGAIGNIIHNSFWKLE